MNFTLNLNDPEFVNLSGFGGSVAVDSHTNNWGTAAAGYDGNGIIICFGVDEFYAYDRTCPHDYVVNSLSVKVNIDPGNSGPIAVCSEMRRTQIWVNRGRYTCFWDWKISAEKLQNKFSGELCYSLELIICRDGACNILATNI